MSQKSTISISFKLEDGANGFKQLSMDADAFRKVIRTTLKEAENLKKSVINFAALSTSFDSITRSFNDIQGVLNGLAGAYSAQIEAETKLGVTMRNSMAAREADIQSIKDLCAAQQALGVIGDEVQLAGAQELATYLKEKESLSALIPVMNDMLAQQYGLNASQENAAQIATMLGKVMDGQTGALKRYGYTFDDTQEQILKFGTETQRAAVLCDVVTAAVGGTNAELAKTDAGKLKQMTNDLGDMKEKLGGVVKSLQPWMTFISSTVISVSAIVKITIAMKVLGVGIAKVGLQAKSLVIRLKDFVLASNKSAAAATGSATAMTGAATAARVLTVALKGLLVGSVIGVVIWGVIEAINYLTGASDEATGSTNRLLDAQERAKRDAEDLKRLYQQETSTLNNASAAMDINISRLKNFNGTKAEEKKLVEDMNNAYGDTMGYFASVSDWYKALTANSKAYCQQMVLEARTRMLANRIAEKIQENHDIIWDETGKKRTYNSDPVRKTEQRLVNGPAGQYFETVEIEGASEKEQAEQQIRENIDSIQNMRKQMDEAAKELAGMTFSVTGSDKRPETTTSNIAKTEKTRLEELRDLIAKAKNDYISASESKRAEIRQNIKGWEDDISAIERLQAEATHSVDLSTLQGIDDEIAYQEELCRHASEENIPVYDAEIRKLKDLKAARERAAITPLPIEEIQTFDQLNEAVKYYTDLLNHGTAQGRIFAKQHLNELGKLSDAWNNVLGALDAPGDLPTLDTIEKLEKAIGYVDNQIKNATADEIVALQRSKYAYEDKLKAYKRGIEIPSMLREADEINKLSGREYKIKIRGMGFDELTNKINALNRMLNDMDNPVTGTQRKEIEDLIATYERWRKEGIDAFGTFREGWSGVEGIGGGVERLTSALEGNANAWQTVTGIVDGFLQIYDGIMAIVGIINMLSTATHTHTTAKMGENAAMTASAAAQTAEVTASEANVAAKIPVIAANKAATASYMELAAAAYFAAHAYIPFAGFGIASGFVSSATAMVKGIGVMPFANGGIVSGPTVGLIGEYAGASNNPEVVAPLDKLRGMLNPAGEPVIIGGTLRASGRDLICVLANETRVSSKSGKHTNIKH